MPEGTGTFSPVSIQMGPLQIATEGFSSDSLSERSPEQHTKNGRTSFFSAKSKMEVKNVIPSCIIHY